MIVAGHICLLYERSVETGIRTSDYVNLGVLDLSVQHRKCSCEGGAVRELQEG